MINMKASDLMLNDWVYAGERLKNVQVSRIYEHSICIKDGFWESEEVSEEDLQPILLNCEIRKQINTKLSEWYDQVKKENRFGGDGETLDIFYDRILTEIQIVVYAHEFQHLLKSYGISIYINLESDYDEYKNY